jgi:vacuolar protein sorting-associated protein 41
MTSLLVLAYIPPDTSFLDGNEMPDNPAQQKRKEAERPELRIISRAGEELASDAISIADFQKWNCNDYVLAEVDDGADGVGDRGRCYVVLSPRDVVVVRPRDSWDHVAWLVEKKRYEDALEAVGKLDQSDVHAGTGHDAVNATEIGQQYIQHLVSEGRSRTHTMDRLA